MPTKPVTICDLQVQMALAEAAGAACISCIPMAQAAWNQYCYQNKILHIVLLQLLSVVYRARTHRVLPCQGYQWCSSGRQLIKTSKRSGQAQWPWPKNVSLVYNTIQRMYGCCQRTALDIYRKTWCIPSGAAMAAASQAASGR